MRLIPAQYVKPFLKGHKNDYRDAEAIAEAAQRPTMNFVTIKTPHQMDLLALHRVRSRLVSLRTGVINQIRGFLIARGITVRRPRGSQQWIRRARTRQREHPEILERAASRLAPCPGGVRRIVDLTVESAERLQDLVNAYGKRGAGWST